MTEGQTVANDTWATKDIMKTAVWQNSCIAATRYGNLEFDKLEFELQTST